LEHRAGAPKGDEFNNLYYSWVDDLPPEVKLPDSDLLKSLHTYSSDYYGHGEYASESLLSMDGTALIASGVLLEELVAESLGNSGELAFCEAKGEDFGALPKFWNGVKWVDHHLPPYTPYGRRRRAQPNRHDLESEPPESQAPESQAPETDGGSASGSTPAPEEFFRQLEEGRRKVETLVVGVQQNKEQRLGQDTQNLLAQSRGKTLSAEDRQKIQARIQQLESQIKERTANMFRP
jgi:hypothetical protein